MIFRALAVLTALLLGGCSKADPSSVTVNTQPKSAPSNGNTVDPPSPSPAPSFGRPGDEQPGHMPHGMEMEGHSKDGGMGHAMGGHR